VRRASLFFSKQGGVLKKKMVSGKLVLVDLLLMSLVMLGGNAVESANGDLFVSSYFNFIAGRPTVIPEYFLFFFFLISFSTIILSVFTGIIFYRYIKVNWLNG